MAVEYRFTTRRRHGKVIYRVTETKDRFTGKSKVNHDFTDVRDFDRWCNRNNVSFVDTQFPTVCLIGDI